MSDDDQKFTKEQLKDIQIACLKSALKDACLFIGNQGVVEILTTIANKTWEDYQE